MMTQFSMMPWETQTGTGDGANSYTQDQANNFFRYFDVRDPASEGVAKGVLNELAVSGSATPLSVATGAAVCYGRYWNDTAVSLAVTTPSVGTTGGRVVLRADWSTNTIRLFVKMSTDGNASIPGLVQTAGTTWEISLATFTVTTVGVITVTDDRAFRKMTAVPGDGEIETSMLEDSAVTGAKIADGTIVTAKIADNQIDDTKVGDRVPQFYRRQGSSTTSWIAHGSTSYRASAVRMQAGAFPVSILNGQYYISTPVTFPAAYSDIPLVIVSLGQTSSGYSGVESVIVEAISVTATGFTIKLQTADHTLSSGTTTRTVNWLAIGPE